AVRGRLPQAAGELVGQLTAPQAPPPVAVSGAGAIHAALAAEAEGVLRGDDRERGARTMCKLDQVPRGLALVEPGSLAQPLRQRVEPAARGIGVVRRCVDDGLLLVVVGVVRISA